MIELCGGGELFLLQKYVFLSFTTFCEYVDLD
jgi:hypothetical protein